MTMYKTEMNVGDCGCGEKVRKVGSRSSLDYNVQRSSIAENKGTPGAANPKLPARFLENSFIQGGFMGGLSTRHRSRRGWHSKYTVSDWQQTNFDRLSVSKGRRRQIEHVTNDSLRIMRDTHCSVSYGQKESTQWIGERINYVNYWRQETIREYELNVEEAKKLERTKQQCDCLLVELENPLKIVQKCLFARSERVGVDQVQDDVEVGLLRELEVIKSIQERICRLQERIAKVLTHLAEARQCLERDSLDKLSALHIDKYAHGLNNTSPGIALYPGVETSDLAMSTPESWMDFSARVVQGSHSTRAESTHLRTETASLLNAAITELRQAWNNTNQSLERQTSWTRSRMV